MIKLTLIHDKFSSLDDQLDLETLFLKNQDDVILSCQEPYFRTGGELERNVASYISKLLPHNYSVLWDGGKIGYKEPNNPPTKLPHSINELRFRVLLQRNKD